MKKFLSLLLSIVMLFSLSASAFNAQSEASTEADFITVEDCYRAGEKWITANYDSETEISSVIPVKDFNEEINGYCINFQTSGEPNGYLLINARKDSTMFIREFSLDGNGIYEQLSINSNITKNIEPAIYTTDSFQYAIKYKDNNEVKVYNSDSTTMSLSEAKVKFSESTLTKDVANTALNNQSAKPLSDKEEIYDLFFNSADLLNYTSENNYVIPGTASFDFYTMDTLRTGLNRGNCAPTALTNLCLYYYHNGLSNILKNNSVCDTYDELVTQIGFNPNIDGEEGPSRDNIIPGLQDYVRSRSYNTALFVPVLNLWVYYKFGFDEGVPCVIFVDGYKLEENVWETTAHAIIGIGYRVLTDNTRYIRVVDGWISSNSRFLNYDSEYLLDIEGTFTDIY